MPEWIKEGGPLVILALGAIWMFLQQFEKWGKSRDEERKAFLSTLESQQQAFTSSMLAMVGLATRMVDACQHHKAGKRITNSEVIEAAERKET